MIHFLVVFKGYLSDVIKKIIFSRLASTVAPAKEKWTLFEPWLAKVATSIARLVTRIKWKKKVDTQHPSSRLLQNPETHLHAPGAEER